MSSQINTPLPLLVIGSAAGGAALLWSWQKLTTRKKKDPETDHSICRGLVWGGISGALNAAMLYTGDRLGLYVTLREMCAKPGSCVTAIDVARETVSLGMERYAAECMQGAGCAMPMRYSHLLP